MRISSLEAYRERVQRLKDETIIPAGGLILKDELILKYRQTVLDHLSRQ